MKSAKALGLETTLSQKVPIDVPAILFTHDGNAWLSEPSPKGVAEILQPRYENDSLDLVQWERVPEAAVKSGFLGWALAVRSGSTRSENEPPSHTGHWFWSALWDHRSGSFHLLVATILVNIFAVALPLYTRIIYDRVIPNHATETMWVVSTGLALVLAFEFVLRVARSRIADVAGKSIDRVLALRVFRHALSISMSARPASAGSFAGNLRSYETVREFFAAATTVAIVDTPIALLMISLVFWLAGPVGWLPVGAAVVVLLFALVIQPVISRLIQTTYEQGILRQALLVESANGLESIKAANAETALEQKMMRIIDSTERMDLKMRGVTQFATAFTALCVSVATVAVIIASVYGIANRTMTMGALIACSMIVGRAMAPLGGLVNLLLRWQQTKSALRAINEIMKLPEENEHSTLSVPIRFPHITLKGVTFRYPHQPVVSIRNTSLSIRPGERIAIIGKPGAGKSTLLRLLARVHRATEGIVMFDGVDITQWPGHVVRQRIGYLPQDGSIFHGSIRENVLLGCTQPSESAFLRAIQLSGLVDWSNAHPHGLNRQVGENGVLISGGQRQTILLARCFMQEPDVLLLDEPSDGLDLSAEKMFRGRLSAYMCEDTRRTLVLSTHKPSLLPLVDRVILMENGSVVMDGPRDDIVQRLKEGARNSPST